MSSANPAVETFVIEARDMLGQLESMLLDLETAPGAELVDAVFRALHTVKGGGAMFGFPQLSAFVHHFEDAFDLVREGKMAISPALLNAALAGRDHALALLSAGDDPVAAQARSGTDGPATLALLKEAVAGSSAPPPPPAIPWTIEFRPSPEALRHGMRPDLLIAELAEIGPLRLTAQTETVPPLHELDPTTSHLGWLIEIVTPQPRSALEAVFIFAEDADLSIQPAEVPVAAILPEAGTPAAVAQPGAQPAGHQPESVRVSSEKLDSILDQLGELVIAQSRLTQIAGSLGDRTLEGVVEEIERLITGLRDTTMSVRMLPIETVFGKFRRVVRDLSAELGKEIHLFTEGGETEIDKNVLDRLSEPLIHMIRNAVDHGIEDVPTRLSRQKPAAGRVTLSARQESGEILIVVADDGGGLNLPRIREKAIERGLLPPDANPGEQAIAQLIFAPGFSTAEAVTSVSGRGVGMDAVQMAINALRGRIHVESRPGQGTEISLRLPLTLAIMDGLLVRLGSDCYVFPLDSIEECVEFDMHELTRASGRSMVQIREYLVPFLDLCETLSLAPSTETRRRTVIVRAGGERLGLVVDDVLGQHQTVIKPMSPFHAGLELFSGATILGDGTVALIIDVAALIRPKSGAPAPAPLAA